MEPPYIRAMYNILLLSWQDGEMARWQDGACIAVGIDEVPLRSAMVDPQLNTTRVVSISIVIAGAPPVSVPSNPWFVRIGEGEIVGA